ncbi:hypothetical protein AALO_G00262790 [Alosa alosa]|uniref:Secreted protein n=1 Tax=Alosa alosa TaxID=278164 RepID=A0AAV6FRW9_9TELE|nr:hypothetical protein AALO_G00262790 [Alosa alosa]
MASFYHPSSLTLIRCLSLVGTNRALHAGFWLRTTPSLWSGLSSPPYSCFPVTTNANAGHGADTLPSSAPVPLG